MKKILGSAAYQLFLATVLGSVFIISFALLPTRASALEMTAQTGQVLPPGGNACAPISATALTPYIYDGALHSFEFTVADASYVALIGSVGDAPLPFYLMTRRIDASGALRIHVDIETTPLRGTLALHVTLLSAPTGQPVCLSTVSAEVESESSQQSPPATSPEPPTEAMPSQRIPTTPESATTSVAASSATPAASVVNAIRSPLRDVCTSEAGAYRLWLMLLVLFTLVVGAALWAEFPMSLPWARTPERVATLILSLLLVLLAFWYLSVPCRAALWMPLLAFLIAILGLLAAFWNHPRVTQILLIQDSNL